MKKTKLMATLLAVSFCITSLVGCSGKSSDKSLSTSDTSSTSADNDIYSGDPVTLKMMVFPSTESYKKIVDGFMTLHPEIKKKVSIDVQLGGSGDFDVAQKLRLALASGGDMPDVIRLNYTQLPEFAQAGVLEPIDSFIKPYKDNIIKNTLEVMQYDSKFYAFPREVKPKVWFYRTDIFSACGIIPDNIKTIDDYIAAGKKIQEKYPNAHMENYNVPSQQYDLMMMLSSTNGRFCDKDGNYNISTDVNVKKTFENIKKIKDSSVNSTVAEWSADWAKSFVDGEIVSQLMGGWFKTDFMNFKIDSLKGKIGISQWPEEIRGGSDAGGAIWVIPASSKNKKITGDLMAKMCFEDASAKMIYGITGIIPPLKTAIIDPLYNAKHDYYDGSLGPVNFKALENLKVYPYTPASSQEIKIVVQYLDQYLSGKVSVDAALKSAEADLKNQIGNPYKK